MQKFLGLANYYCQFIEGFASIARLLHDIVKKNQKWDWAERQEKVFRELKERFTQEPVLAAPDLDKENEDGSKHVRLCYRRGATDGMQRQIMETSGIHFQIIE